MLDTDRIRPTYYSPIRSILPQDGDPIKSLVKLVMSGSFASVLENGASLTGINDAAYYGKFVKDDIGVSDNLVGYRGRTYGLSYTRGGQIPSTVSFISAFTFAECGSKVAEDYKDRFLTKKKDIKMSALESIITCENAAFYRAFMTEWNSGSCSRDYESYCRQLRQSLNRHNYFRTKDFVVGNVEESVGKIEQYILSKGWQIVFGSEKFFWFMYVLDNIPILFGEAKFSDSLMSITIEGDKVSIVEAMDELTECYHDAGIKVNNLLNIGKLGNNIQTSYMFPDEQVIAKPHFYPWLKEYATSLEELFNDYINSNKSVLLLIGPPGVGKSTFIRSILFYAKNENNYLCSNEQALVSDGFIPWLAGLENKSMIAIEDADNFVASREKDGNASMSGLLNTADGVIPRKNKIIISTNLPTINRVDPALVRPGRCHRVLEFRNLTYNEACHVREMEGLSVFETPSKKEYSLAEVLCGNDLADIKARKCASIGF